MTYEELRERVGQLIAEAAWNCGNDCVSHGEQANAAATVAIRTVIEALAQEDVTPHGVWCLSLMPDDYVTEQDELRLANWLNSHLPETTP